MGRRKSVEVTSEPKPPARRKINRRHGLSPEAAMQARSGAELAEDLEEVARAITERTLARLAGPGEHLRELVEAHWQTTARELRAGLMDAQGNILTSRFVAQRRPSEGIEASGRSRGHSARIARAAPKE